MTFAAECGCRDFPHRVHECVLALSSVFGFSGERGRERSLVILGPFDPGILKFEPILKSSNLGI